MCSYKNIRYYFSMTDGTQAGYFTDLQKHKEGRPKLTWDESVKRDLKDWNISKEIALIGALGD